MTRSRRLVVQKVHNNNVVLALDEAGRSVVATGAGVGFGARRGSLVDPATVDSVYVPQGRTRAEVAADTLAGFPAEELEVARKIVAEAQELTGLARPEILLLPVADHLHHALLRTRADQVVDLPLVWEVRHLYPRELAAGRRALDRVRARFGVQLPADEATAFALHFVSASFTGAVLDRTVTMTQALTAIFDDLDAHRPTPIDREGEAAARFVTHLRYLFVRLAEGRRVTDVPSPVRNALESSVPEVMRRAREVGAILEETWGHPVSSDETAYIALHIHRLVAESSPEA